MPCCQKLDLNLTANVAWYGSDYEDVWFVGFTGKPQWFTIRGGYRLCRTQCVAS